MHLIKLDRKAGTVRLRLDSPDDLWTLRRVITPGDTIRAPTERKLKVGSGKEEKSQVTRKRMVLTITVEKVDYAEDGSALRTLGTIVDGPEEVPRGEHHSFALEPGLELTIKKESWHEYQLKRLREATTRDRPILVMLFDREEARLYSVTRRGIEEIATVRGSVAKKAEAKTEVKDFYREIVGVLQERAAEYDHIVAGAPAFWREYLEQAMPDEMRSKTVFTTISAVQKTAIREMLGRPEVQRLIKENSTLRESALVAEALEALQKERLAYGVAEVREALEQGNGAKLLVTEDCLAQRTDEVEPLLAIAEQSRCEVTILAEGGEVGGLGGIVVLRRW